ncbi:MAG TPA: hypothetical protein VFK80_05135 [Limnochordia bacterium]|nr:hypothetical protein [Limnochordia bacterium]
MPGAKGLYYWLRPVHPWSRLFGVKLFYDSRMGSTYILRRGRLRPLFGKRDLSHSAPLTVPLIRYRNGRT